MGRAWVALAAGAAAQLVVDAPRLVQVGADHVQAAELRHLPPLRLENVVEGLAHALVRLAREVCRAALDYVRRRRRHREQLVEAL